MIRKKYLLCCAMILLLSLFTGCEKEKAENEVRLDAYGISYEAPKLWTEGENINLMPFHGIDEDGDIYGKLLYTFAPDENMDELNNLESEIPMEELMTPLFEFLVVKEDKLETKSLTEEKEKYLQCEELPAKKGFHFFFLTEPKEGTVHFSKEAKAVYQELQNSLKDLKASIKTFPPVPPKPDESGEKLSKEEIEKMNQEYFNFISKDLAGETVLSSMYQEHNITMINFWASYAYPDINELPELQKLYTTIQDKHPDMDMIQVIIDTPDAAAEEAARKAYAENGVTFTGVTLNPDMASWVLDNVKGLPTTIFVDGSGKILGEPIEKSHTADFYLAEMQKRLGQ